MRKEEKKKHVLRCSPSLLGLRICTRSSKCVLPLRNQAGKYEYLRECIQVGEQVCSRNSKASNKDRVGRRK